MVLMEIQRSPALCFCDQMHRWPVWRSQVSSWWGYIRNRGKEWGEDCDSCKGSTEGGSSEGKYTKGDRTLIL
ncbi:hypothetical protein Hdeb2414_s0002g00056981 [Helianthus debilis subsp. tardiflorus]